MGFVATRTGERTAMVQRDIAGRGVRDERVLAAMAAVPRELFVPEGLAERAYDDAPLPIESGQTISQPFIVAWMAELLELRGDERVLEVGAGSGYAAAVLGLLAREVHTIERHAGLAASAEARLAKLGFTNVRVHVGDGSLGLRQHAPFNAILVSAGAARRVPGPLLDELAIGGRLVAPVGGLVHQTLVRVRRRDALRFEQEALDPVRFVPLIEESVREGPEAPRATPRESQR